MSDYEPTPLTSKPVSVQKWRQKSSNRFEFYDQAKKFFDALPSSVPKKRIRRRPEGHFDVILYEPLPQPKKEKVEEAA